MVIHLDETGMQGTSGVVEFSLECSAFQISVRY